MLDTGALITRDGALRFLPDGRLVTDKAGAPCCCGGGGCCFCSDIEAAPGDPCYDPYQPGTCGPPACCCGRSWEWAMLIQTRREVPDGRWWTIDMDLLARIDIVGETCVRQVTSLRSTWRGKTSLGYDNEVLNTKLVFTGNLFNSTSFYCRVTPQCAAECISTASDGTFPFSPGFTIGEMRASFHQPPCSGERVSGSKTFTWTSVGGCASGEMTYREAADFAGTNNDYVATAAAQWSVKRLDAKCCGDDNPGAGPFTPAPPLIPADPNNPGARWLCPQCASRFDGVKCRVCQYCAGCGG